LFRPDLEPAQNKTKDVGRLWGSIKISFEPLASLAVAVLTLRAHQAKVLQPFMKQINMHAVHVKLLAFD